MITQLNLQYFKCFENLKLPLSNLTLLTGMNSAGKSSVIQSLLLLSQTMNMNEWGKSFLLNGSMINIGNAGDLIDNVTSKNEINISVESEDFWAQWEIFSSDRKELSMFIERFKVTFKDTDSTRTYLIPETEIILRNLVPSSLLNDIKFSNFVNTIKNIAYISAERLGPKEVHQLYSPENLSNVGVIGEKTASYLYHNQDVPILNPLRIQTSPPLLLRQTEAWLDVFFPGSSLELRLIEEANLAVLLLRSSKETKYHKPQNVGFGITQVLPIIVACLASAKDQLLIIENPESHLHPSGQSLMGEFLCKCVSAGINLIVESHSDHVLNGIRKSVKKRIINPEKVKLHFFQSRYFEGNIKETQIISPTIDLNGNIDEWPKGFFDQLENDMEMLIDWRP